MHQVQWKKIGLIGLSVVTLLLLVVSIMQTLKYVNYKESIDTSKQRTVEIKTRESALIIDNLIKDVENRHLALAKAITESLQPLIREKSMTEALTSESLAKLNKLLKDNVMLPYPLANNVDERQTLPHCERKQDRKTSLELPLSLAEKINVFGSAIAFTPEFLQAFGHLENNRWSTYFHEYEGLYVQKYIHHELDYTDSSDPTLQWFTKVIEDEQSQWVNPYMDHAGDTFMITFSSLIYEDSQCYGKAKHENSHGECQPIGVVTADLSINQLESILQALLNELEGFAALTFANGVYVYHPIKEFVKDNQSLESIGKGLHLSEQERKIDNDRLTALNLAKHCKGETIQHISQTTGVNTFYVVEPLRQTGWSMQNTFYQSSLYSERELDDLRQFKMKAIMWSLMAITGVLGIICLLASKKELTVWLSVVLLTSLIISSIATIWWLALDVTKPKNSEDIAITTAHSASAAIDKYIQSLNGTLKDSEVTSVPTGIFIESIDLKDANEINVSGIVWQVVDSDCFRDCGEPEYDESIVGVTFSGAKKANFKDKKVIQTDQSTIVVKQWFEATIASEMDYSRYPLEIEFIDLHIVSNSEQENVLLIPDVASYRFDSNRKPGLSEDIFVPGWNVFRSYYTLKTPSDDLPSFGMRKDFDKKPFDELHFKIGLKRIFIDAFISNLTPLIVVSIILFSVALLPTTVDISRVLGICVSVFFVVVFSHLAIRRSIAIGEIFYLEYFFFTIYVMLLLVPINAFRATLGIESQLFDYKNGLIIKALYWPSLLSIFFAITMYKFY